ncbi:MAG TPA: class I SAM-dependent methyltransferase [Gaiellaceae bacterium]|jgi:release factor glutamine methyltransferase
MALETTPATAFFGGIELAVAPGRVMIPRPTTEALVDLALERARRPGALVADVGTGSGAVAVALAVAAPEARIWATDTSADAVQLAEENARRHGVSDRVVVRRGDLLDPTAGPFDVIVANLPYLPASEHAAHPDLVGEPTAAVFAPGDGLGHYRRLLHQAWHRLRPDGLVLVQVRGRIVGAERAGLHRLAALLADGPDALLEAA